MYEKDLDEIPGVIPDTIDLVKQLLSNDFRSVLPVQGIQHIRDQELRYSLATGVVQKDVWLNAGIPRLIDALVMVSELEALLKNEILGKTTLFAKARLVRASIRALVLTVEITVHEIRHEHPQSLTPDSHLDHVSLKRIQDVKKELQHCLAELDDRISVLDPS